LTFRSLRVREREELRVAFAITTFIPRARGPCLLECAAPSAKNYSPGVVIYRAMLDSNVMHARAYLAPGASSLEKVLVPQSVCRVLTMEL